MGGEVVVIGFGNTLRGDDGVGPRAVEAVAGWRLPGVRALTVPQLVPELTEELAAARLAVFVDAYHCGEEEGVQVRPLQPRRSATMFGHVSDPSFLLALANQLHGRQPQAWLVTVPAPDFDLREGLTPAAGRSLEAALVEIRRLVQSVNEVQE